MEEFMKFYRLEPNGLTFLFDVIKHPDNQENVNRELTGKQYKVYTTVEKLVYKSEDGEIYKTIDP